jgi:hypothetical protein
MTTRSELEELADQCLECAETDHGSLNDHLSGCKVCGVYQEKAEDFNLSLEALQVMSRKTEDERYSMLEARVQRYLTMNDNQRIDAVHGIMDVTGDLTDEERMKILRTWTELITRLPKEKRDQLLESIKAVIGTWKLARRHEEYETVVTVTRDYPLLKRTMVRKMFKRMIH